MDAEEMKARTKAFALEVVKLTSEIPDTSFGNIVRNQLIRCSTSVGANYRADCRAQTTAAFIAKLNIVLEEADETAYWLEILIESELVLFPKNRLSS